MDIRYLAGLIDGDGTITIGSLAKGYKAGLPYFQVKIIHLETLMALKLKFGGSIYVQILPSGKEIGTWRIQGNQALSMLRRMLPYLSVRKGQAEVVLEYGGKVSFKGGKVPKEEFDRRAFYIKKVKELNIK